MPPYSTAFRPTLDPASASYLPHVGLLAQAVRGGEAQQQLAAARLSKTCLEQGVRYLTEGHEAFVEQLHSWLQEIPPIESARDHHQQWRRFLYHVPGNQSALDKVGWERVRAMTTKCHKECFLIATQGAPFRYQTPNVADALYHIGFLLRHPAKGRTPHGAIGAATTCFEARYLLMRGLNQLAILFSNGQIHVPPGENVIMSKLIFDVEMWEHLHQLPLQTSPAANIIGQLVRVSPELLKRGELTLLYKEADLKANYELKAQFDLAVQRRALAPIRVVEARRLMPNLYNKLIYLRITPPSHLDALLSRNPLLPHLQERRITREYVAQGVSVIEQVLRLDVLNEFRRIVLESTSFHDLKISYTGTYWSSENGGFYHPLVLHFSAALQAAFPFIQPHQLQNAWCYAYSNTPKNIGQSLVPGLSGSTGVNEGIPSHADEARINFNMWLSKDDANLELGSGGLVVWRKKPPANFAFEDYNEINHNKGQLDDFIATAGEPIRVAHRQNRAVVFDSDFLHRSDSAKFKPGHANRRLNLTFLFGAMQRYTPMDH